jgi:hypothetical protein
MPAGSHELVAAYNMSIPGGFGHRTHLLATSDRASVLIAEFGCQLGILRRTLGQPVEQLVLGLCVVTLHGPGQAFEQVNHLRELRLSARLQAIELPCEKVQSFADLGVPPMQSC